MASDFTFLQYVEKTSDEMYALLKEACLIPAPSGKEEKRAEFCLKWFHENGLKDAYIDDALNVVCPINCEGKDKITVFAAHTDTVFPDLEPMPYYEKDGKMIRRMKIKADHVENGRLSKKLREENQKAA